MHQKELIDIIKKRREELDVTQEYLSELSNVGLRTLKTFESGKGNPTLSTINKLLEVLGLELAINVKKVNN